MHDVFILPSGHVSKYFKSYYILLKINVLVFSFFFLRIFRLIRSSDHNGLERSGRPKASRPTISGVRCVTTITHGVEYEISEAFMRIV